MTNDVSFQKKTPNEYHFCCDGGPDRFDSADSSAVIASIAHHSRKRMGAFCLLL